MRWLCGSGTRRLSSEFKEQLSRDCVGRLHSAGARPEVPDARVGSYGVPHTRCCFEFSRALFAHTPDLLVHYCTPLTQTRTSSHLPPGPVHRRYSSSPSSIQACTQRKASPSAICSPPPPPDQRQTTGTSHTSSCHSHPYHPPRRTSGVEHRRGKPWMEVLGSPPLSHQPPRSPRAGARRGLLD